MENIDLIIYFCLVFPIIPVIFAIKDRKAKLLLLFLIIGVTISLVSAQFNKSIINLLNYDILDYSKTLAPLVEELMKLIPLLLFITGFKNEKDDIIQLAFAIGIGFAIYENILILVQNINNVSILWSLTRGIGAAFMHSICTATITIGFRYIEKGKKYFSMGILGLYSIAVLFHGTFNTLVDSNYMVISLLMPLILYILGIGLHYKNNNYKTN